MKAKRVHPIWRVLVAAVAGWLVLGAAVAMVLLIVIGMEAAVRAVLALLGWA